MKRLYRGGKPLMYQVFAFYPNIDLKVRITEYKTKAEAYEYISGLRMCETPYAAWKNWKDMIDIETYERNIDREYKWMARNKKSGNLIVFARKPYKDPVFERWTYNLPIPICSIPVFNEMFKSITWEDAEPTLIKDIYAPQILNDAEKKYLTAVLKPLPEVESIQKIVLPPINNAFLAISFYSKETMCFPFFEEGSMYNGIEVGKAYTPEELGIEV